MRIALYGWFRSMPSAFNPPPLMSPSLSTETSTIFRNVLAASFGMKIEGFHLEPTPHLAMNWSNASLDSESERPPGNWIFPSGPPARNSSFASASKRCADWTRHVSLLQNVSEDASRSAVNVELFQQPLIRLFHISGHQPFRIHAPSGARRRLQYTGDGCRTRGRASPAAPHRQPRRCGTYPSRTRPRPVPEEPAGTGT